MCVCVCVREREKEKDNRVHVWREKGKNIDRGGERVKCGLGYCLSVCVFLT